MLTKDSKKVLDFMNNNPSNLEGAFFEISYLAEKLPFSDSKILAVCETLEKEGFVTLGGYNTAVKILEKGINYKDLDRQDLIKFLNRSVIIPFFVSLATSLITMVIANYFN